MENKTDLARIESYSLALTEKLANEFFQQNASIKGEHILKFSPIEQVNYFILSNLFERWHEESEKIKSPYFNYDALEVKEAIQVLLNKLSQNISIRKEFFKPLLQKAISDSILLAISPAGYLKNELLNSADFRSTIKLMKERIKYIRVNKAVYIYIMEKLNENFSSSQEAIQTLDNILPTAPPCEDPEKIIAVFSALLRLEKNDIIPSGFQETEVKKEIPEPEKVTEDKVATLNQTFIKNQATLNDTLMQNRHTLADVHKNARIESLKTSISINQRFLFVKNLFNGENSAFDHAVSEIDNCQNYESARSLIATNYLSRYQWDAGKEEVKEFFEIVERKFR